MNALAKVFIEAASRAAIASFVQWLAKQQRAEGWKPTEADIDGFLADLDADTPEKIREEAKRELEGGS